jgi:large subunit ribosomal protein L35
MPKIRTNKTAAKRFKISGTGKITRTKAYNSHQFLHKRASRKRRLEQEPEVFQGELKRMRRLLVLGHTKVKDKPAKPAAAPEAVEQKQAENRAKLVAMVSRG